MAILKARDRIKKTQLRYKQDFDERIRVSNRNILPGQCIYLYPRDGKKVHGKLGPITEGSSYMVLLNDKRTFVITAWRGRGTSQFRPRDLRIST